MTSFPAKAIRLTLGSPTYIKRGPVPKITADLETVMFFNFLVKFLENC